jgi:hypothetical protein
MLIHFASISRNAGGETLAGSMTAAQKRAQLYTSGLGTGQPKHQQKL